MKSSKLVLGLIMGVVWSGLAVPLQTAQAVLSPLGSAGETIVFSDDFNNNNNGWSNIGPGNNQATIGTDPGGTGATVWYPSVAGTVAVGSSLTLPTALDIKNGQIDVYMRVRVDTPQPGSNVNGNKYDITLGRPGAQDNTPPFGRYMHYPNLQSQAVYNLDGTLNNDQAVNFTKPPVVSASTFLDLRMQMDYLPSTNKMNLTLSYYDTASGSYTTLGQLGASSQANIGNGLFNNIWLWQSNRLLGSAARDYYDSVVISQVVPEPATLALISLSLLGLLRRNRRRA